MTVKQAMGKFQGWESLTFQILHFIPPWGRVNVGQISLQFLNITSVQLRQCIQTRILQKNPGSRESGGVPHQEDRPSSPYLSFSLWALPSDSPECPSGLRAPRKFSCAARSGRSILCSLSKLDFTMVRGPEAWPGARRAGERQPRPHSPSQGRGMVIITGNSRRPWSLPPWKADPFPGMAPCLRMVHWECATFQWPERTSSQERPVTLLNIRRHCLHSSCKIQGFFFFFNYYHH